MIWPPERDADHIFEFQTIPFSSAFNCRTPDKMKESIFSPSHWGQYHDVIEKLSAEPHCHGQYYLGVIIQKLLSHFANGDVNLFRSVKVRKDGMFCFEKTWFWIHVKHNCSRLDSAPPYILKIR